MPRRLSDDTKDIYLRLWYWPWASAADIAGVTGLKTNVVSNVLKRGERRGWLVSARLGRTSMVADRYVFTNLGLEALQVQFGWQTFWWHTADAVRSLARRLEVVEMAYRYLPSLWQSNLVSRPSVYVYGDMPYTTPVGGRSSRTELVELNWSRAELVGFHWLKTGPFEAIATYSNGVSTELLHLPVLWRANFQKPADVVRIRWDMREALEEDGRWYSLPQAQALGNFPPGMIIFCPDRVSAAMVLRNWRSTLNRREDVATPAIIDAQGQVVRAMTPPTAHFRTFYLPPGAGDLKDVLSAVASLGNRAYAAANGLRSWRVFRAIDGSPGVTRDQISAAVLVNTTAANRLLAPMLAQRVLTRVGGGHYLDASGRGLLADSQRKSRSGVKRRWGVYAERGWGVHACSAAP